MVSVNNSAIYSNNLFVRACLYGACGFVSLRTLKHPHLNFIPSDKCEKGLEYAKYFFKFS